MRPEIKSGSTYTGFRYDEPSAPLYRRVLGAAFDGLPARLRDLHGTSAARRWQGHAEVRHGGGFLARLIRRVVGFPKAGTGVPVTVDFTPDGDGELWTRTFDGKVFSSHQSPGMGRDAQLLVERFGAAAFSLALVVEGDRLLLIPRRWKVWGVPKPGFLLPTGISFEHESAGQFGFDVEISAPWVGLIVGYRGTLDPT